MTTESTVQTSPPLRVMITGAGRGIGLGLAVRYLQQGADVLITGRSARHLEAAAAEHPGLRTLVSDISRPADRAAAAGHVRADLGGLDVLINNAGIQRRIGLADDFAPWDERQHELDTLLSGPVHLTSLLIDELMHSRRPGVIVNVTSGGAFVPQPFAPLYSAAKAALHSYTTNLRFALAATGCRVVELIPPAVATGLAGDGAVHGADLDAFCDAAFAALSDRQADHIGYGPTATAAFTQRLRDDERTFARMAGRFPVAVYERAA